jgi:hypothetical protein
MKEQQRSVYRTLNGREIDMHKLSLQNEMTVAVGNVRVNARGDELGPGGKIVKKREEILKEYYDTNPNAIPDESVARKQLDETPVTAPVTAAVKAVKKELDDPSGGV